MRVLLVEDEPYMADAVLDRDIPGPSGDEIATCIVASGNGMPILMLTAADRLDDKATGFELGADALGRIKVCVTRVFGRNIVKLCCQGSRSVGVPAGVRSAGRMDSRRPDARPSDSHHRRHTPGCDRIALPPDRVGGPQRRVPRAR